MKCMCLAVRCVQGICGVDGGHLGVDSLCPCQQVMGGRGGKEAGEPTRGRGEGGGIPLEKEEEAKEMQEEQEKEAVKLETGAVAVGASMSCLGVERRREQTTAHLITPQQHRWCR